MSKTGYVYSISSSIVILFSNTFLSYYYFNDYPWTSRVLL